MENTRKNIRGNWNSIKGQVREQYSDLTDDDLRYEEGQEDELLGRIERRTGKSQQEIGEFIDSVSMNSEPGSNDRRSDANRDLDADERNKENDRGAGPNDKNRDSERGAGSNRKS